jgi:N-methylhydantoinase B
MGLCRHYEILQDGVTFATYSDRFRLAPDGLFGGKPGGRAQTLLKRGEKYSELPSKGSFALQKGDILMIQTGGGGGYGDPAERLPENIAQDLAQAFVTAEAAE